MSNSINFVLDYFNCDVQMDICGSMFKYPVLPSLDVDATAIYYADLTKMCETFLYQTDANDVVDAANTDLKYLIDPSNWLVMNPALAQMGDPLSQNPISTTNSMGTKYATNEMFIAHDFIRYLADGLFGTPYGVDLFYNKNQLYQHIKQICGSEVGSAWYNITQMLINIGKNGTNPALNGTTNKMYLTNDVPDDSNVCRRVLQTLITVAPERFSNIQNTTGFQTMPFIENDSLNFKLILYPSDYQNDLTGTGQLLPRSYGIKLILTSNPVNLSENVLENA